MYKRIMAAIDSGYAESTVLQTAIALARDLKAKLAICHALDDTLLAQRFARVVYPDGVISPIEEALRNGAFEFLSEAVEFARERGIEPEIRIAQSENDHVPELLLKAAAQWQADLLVVGSRGSQGVERLLGGSIGEQLSRKAPISLLLVRS